MHDQLKPNERERLNCHEFIDKSLKEQWQEAKNDITDPAKEERILNNILKQIHTKKENPLRSLFFSYGAAMIAICLTISAIVMQRSRVQEIIYVMNTGFQSIDSVKLADGTTVMLNAGSTLTYPKDFSGKNREVELSGQAFFNVKPDKEHPFIVKTKNMDVNVLGTSFEVFSYDDDKQAEAILLTGKVEVTLPDTETNEKYILHPNEKLSYKENGEITIAKVDADAYSAWRNGKRMSFKNESLEMILPRLEKWYGQKIECDARLAQRYQFTFTIHNESLDLILNYISHSAPLNYRLINNNRYIIEKKK